MILNPVNDQKGARTVTGRDGQSMSFSSKKREEIVCLTEGQSQGARRRGEIWTNIQCRILKRIAPGNPNCCNGSVYEGKSKLAILFGDEFLSKVSGKTIVDFGCGEGVEAAEIAQLGAKRVIGIDIREDVLQTARQKALTAGVQNICLFCVFGE